MDASHLPPPDLDISADPFDSALRSERDQVREFLTAKQRQLDDAEQRLLASIGQMADEIAGSRQAIKAARHDVDAQAEQLAHQAEQIEQLRADLNGRRAEWQRAVEETAEQQRSLLQTLRQEQQSLQEQRAALEQQQAALERRQADATGLDRAGRELIERQLVESRGRQERLETELATLRTQYDALKQEAAVAQAATLELDALRGERDTLTTALHEAERRLEQTQWQLRDAEDRMLTCLEQFADDMGGARRATETVGQDANQQAAQLAQEAEHLEHLRTDLDARRAEWQQTAEETTRQQQSLLETLRQEQQAIEHQRTALERQCEALERQRAEWIEFDRTEKESLQRELDNSRRERERLETELAAARDQFNALTQRADATNVDREQFEALRQERDTLCARLHGTEHELEHARQELDAAKRLPADTTPAATPDQTPADLRERYALAMEDLRDLRRENARLQGQLKEAENTRQAAPPALATGGPLNWEAEKQRILAQLASDFDDDDEDQRQRLEIEQVVERTERILADKDAEVAELKQLLDNQSASVGSLAVGAAALGEMLDKDAIVQEERKNLAQLQAEWREKLRKAEVELSLERAKLARERTQLDEKLRLIEEHAGSASDGVAGNASPGKPPRSRWLTRLGLNDPDRSGEA